MAKGKRISGMPIGTFLNNPLNIKRTTVQWKGEDNFDPHPTFCKFTDIKYGFRAAFMTLHTYMTKHKLRTIRKIITRWAPPSENDTERYIRFVAGYCGIPADAKIAFSDAHIMCDIVRSMAQMETNTLNMDAIIRAAYEMVCVQKDVSPSYLNV